MPGDASKICHLCRRCSNSAAENFKFPKSRIKPAITARLFMITRKLKNTVHLETRCDGEAHDGCQAGCLLYWKEDWLKPGQWRFGEPLQPTGPNTKRYKWQRKPSRQVQRRIPSGISEDKSGERPGAHILLPNDGSPSRDYSAQLVGRTPVHRGLSVRKRAFSPPRSRPDLLVILRAQSIRHRSGTADALAL